MTGRTDAAARAGERVPAIMQSAWSRRIVHFVLLILSVMTAAYGRADSPSLATNATPGSVPAATPSPTPSPSPTPGIFRCKDQKHIKEISLNNTGEIVEGPICAQITINALRYYADFGKTTSYSAGPVLTTVLPTSKTTEGANLEGKGLDANFKIYQKRLNDLQKNLQLIQADNRTAYSSVDKYLETLRALINQTDGVLANAGPSAVVALVSSPDVTKAMDEALAQARRWHTTENIVDQLRSLQADLTAMPQNFPQDTGSVKGDPCAAENRDVLGWTSWDKCYDSAFKVAQSAVADLLTQAGTLTSDSDKAVQFGKKVGIILYWKNQFLVFTQPRAAELFVRQAEVTCGVLFNKNSSTTLKLMVADLTATFDNQQPSPQAKDNLLVVECGSAFSISAGVGFSLITNREFALVKSTPAAGGTTSTTVFGVTSDSAINPMAIALTHARLWDSDDHRYALHFSFGVAANIQGQNSGGSSAAFLVGPSISFLRTVYVTPGLQIAKQSQLSGGFQVGQTVPSDITSPPVSSSYKTGFGFAISFTKP